MEFTLKPQVIAIAGVSRAGKTSAAYLIQRSLPQVPVRIFHLDNFVFPEEQIPLVNGHIDWERPESTDFDALLRHVEPHVDRPGITIIEGLFPFSDQRLCSLYNKVVYLSIPFSEFYQRKTTDLRWGAEPSWYVRYIWLSHFRYGLPPGNFSGRLLNITNFSEEHYDGLLNFITGR